MNLTSRLIVQNSLKVEGLKYGPRNSAITKSQEDDFQVTKKLKVEI